MMSILPHLPKLGWADLVLGMAIYKVGQGVLSVIDGARAARRVNLQLGALLTWIMVRDPMFVAILAKTGVTTMGEKTKK